MARSTRSHILCGGLVCLLASCGSASTGPASVAGGYSATAFKLAFGADTIDILAGGGHLTLELHANGTATGQVFVPAALNGGTEYSVSLAGTFTLSDEVVTLSMVPSSFLNSMTFTVSGRTLLGDSSQLGSTVILTLARPLWFAAA